MDYDTGRRVAFGREGAPVAALDEAVTASCAIPGWYAPVLVDGRRYVDGGTLSTTSADLLAREGLDEVYVLAPMAVVRRRPAAHGGGPAGAPAAPAGHPAPGRASAQTREPGRRRGHRARRPGRRTSPRSAPT